MWDPTKPVAPRTIADFEAAASLLMVEQVVVPAWRAELVDLDSVVVVKLKPVLKLILPHTITAIVADVTLTYIVCIRMYCT